MRIDSNLTKCTHEVHTERTRVSHGICVRGKYAFLMPDIMKGKIVQFVYYSRFFLVLRAAQCDRFSCFDPFTLYYMGRKVVRMTHRWRH